jgi:hypothetical protein
MYNELRYQAKTHAISEMPRKEKRKKKFLHLLPQKFLFYFYYYKKIKTCYKGE